MESLPPNTLAVMVGKLHADRVTRYLRGKDGTLDLQDQTQNDPEPQEETDQEDSSTAPPIDLCNNQVELLDDPALTGVSRARRGYYMLLVKETRRSVAGMSPMGRQNISFVGRITHCMEYNGLQESTDVSSNTPSVSFAKIWDAIQQDGFDLVEHLLRMECYPRSQNDYVCRQLDLAAQVKLQSDNNTPTSLLDRGDRPIPLTASRTKCTHRLTVIVLASHVYWGLECRTQHDDTIMVPLNDIASAEITTTPCNPETGKDLLDGVDVTTPLSRAYFKLQEVWTDYLQKHSETLQLGPGSAGLDIGAAPGGWTQVMVHSMQLSNVVALDAARLADRILKQPQVTHIPNKLEDDSADWNQHGPFRMVVCDACVLWHLLLDGLLENFKRLNVTWSRPVTFVITLKLPFKTLQSIKRQVRQINERASAFASDLAAILFPKRQVHTVHRLVHLMANSDSERTLILVFSDKAARMGNQ